MHINHKSWKIILKIAISIFLFLQISTSLAQTENDAMLAIQQAEERLIDVIILLEGISETSIDTRDLVVEADSLRLLIYQANKKLEEGDYEQAYQTANDAKEQLDSLLNLINQRISGNKQRSRVLYSVLGFLAAAFTLAFVILFLRRIYPWFKTKQLEEYGNLEIKYEQESEEITHGKN
ncbi:MAG: hypothetical protein KAS63_00410 [Candidatus Heimdallarchaeota archaeon]|nr:hypothetical protein [Candidatus Heimdallarchaeota archaeon]MCK4953805.1 hypothetical protein [Candidatus Heimdallarchaeota archaeon]